MTSSALEKSQRAMARAMAHPIDWLVAMIASWIVPLEFFGRPSTYFTSLLFWAVPVALLLPRFFMETDAKRAGVDASGRRRRAFFLTVLFVVAAGAILDFLLGKVILNFDPRPHAYLTRIGPVPIEELFFYILGGMAIVLVYVWADEYWMREYSVRRHRWNDEMSVNSQFRLLGFSRTALLWAVGLIALGAVIKWRLTGAFWPPPYYFLFLVVIALAPAIAVSRQLLGVVNWRALSFTCLYVLVTSCIWEVTLGIPRQWWWYKEPPAVIGWYINAFGYAGRPYPVEALIVWLAISFDAILAYEFLKGITYERRPLRAAF